MGYQFAPWVSAGGELRYQRWLSHPHLGNGMPFADANMDTVTMAIGPRFHFAAAGLKFKPGISYTRGLDNPMKDAKYNIVQIDVPIIF